MVKNIRTKKQYGITQVGLAEKPDLSDSAIFRIETDDTFPKAETIIKFTNIFMVDCKELFNFTKEENCKKQTKKYLLWLTI